MGRSHVSRRTFVHTVVLALHGDIDEAASEQLRRELVDAMMRRRPRRLVIDLSRTRSLGAGALGALIAAHDSAPDLQLALTLRGAPRGVASELANHGLPAARSSAAA